MKQNEFDNLIKEIDPTDMIPYIIDKMINKPHYLTGFKKINTFALRMYASFGQANNIKYGTVLENYFSKYLEELGWTILDRDYNLTEEEKRKYKNASDKVNIDLVAKYKDTVIFIEQKILDNHDSTKKTGQSMNFQEKATIIHRERHEDNIYGFEWFIDDSQAKNRKNWITRNEEYEKSHPEYKNKLFVVYGTDLEDKLNSLTGLNHSGMLYSFDEFMKSWHLSHGKKLPEMNFDKYPMDVVDQLKLDKYTYYKIYNMFTNNELKEQIHPIIFPNNQVYRLYLEHLKNVNINDIKKREYPYYKKLLNELDNIIRSNS